VKASGYQWGIAIAKRSMADLSMAKGDSVSALALWQESYELFMQIGDVWAAREVSRFLIWQKVIHGEFEDGIRLSMQNLLFYEEYGDPGGVASSYFNLGTIACEEGQYESARRYFKDALALSTESGNRRGIVDAAEQLAYLLYLEGQIVEGRAKYQEVLAQLKDIPNDSFYGLALSRFAQISLSENRLGEAREALAVGAAFLQKNISDVDIYTVYYGLGELARLESHYSQATENYRPSLRAAQNTSNYIAFPRILDGIAKTKCLQSKFHEAACIFGGADALRKEMGIIIHIVEHPDYDKHIELLKSKISPAEFESAWVEGAKMSLEEVYQYVMQKGD
jgi:tetratricopeptide (TPR) repeat protein